MIFTISQLLDDVMARMGETPEVSPTAGTSGIPTPADVLRRKISSFLPEVGKKLLKDALLEELSGAESYRVDVTARKVECGLYAIDIPLPEDFACLVSLRMQSWKRKVSDVIPPESGLYLKQYSREPGIAGCPSSPHVYLHPSMLTAIGSESESDAINHLLIWRMPTIASDGTFRFPALLYHQLVSSLIILL